MLARSDALQSLQIDLSHHAALGVVLKDLTQIFDDGVALQALLTT